MNLIKKVFSANQIQSISLNLIFYVIYSKKLFLSGLKAEEEKNKLVTADNIKENLQDSGKKSDEEEPEDQEDISSLSKEEINAIDPQDA